MDSARAVARTGEASDATRVRHVVRETAIALDRGARRLLLRRKVTGIIWDSKTVKNTGLEPLFARLVGKEECTWQFEWQSMGSAALAGSYFAS